MNQAVQVIDQESEVISFEPLSVDEDTFALAVIECNGNVRLAYRMAFGENALSPMANGQKLLSKPAVLARINELSSTIKESALISLGGHLVELAEIRDLAKSQGQLKVALVAERTRGEVAGLYNDFQAGGKSKDGPTNIQINFVSKHDVNI